MQFQPGKRYQVFSIKETKERDGRTNAVWVRAGSAWVNRDGSFNVYLDVLPLDGKLHVREAVAERREDGGRAQEHAADPVAA
ncbi:MAG: hypothetical protein INH41_00575 [Myxococcaceae bacterium]|nr:hypothetical protein [Myxococcaceae bacterium]MCA3010871.1 hypothetical protein [Myxococcaceae bacterium]